MWDFYQNRFCVLQIPEQPDWSLGEDSIFFSSLSNTLCTEQIRKTFFSTFSSLFWNCIFTRISDSTHPLFSTETQKKSFLGKAIWMLPDGMCRWIIPFRLNQIFFLGFWPQSSACAFLWAKLGFMIFFLQIYSPINVSGPRIWSLHCNFNGEIDQKLDWFITFDWRVLLT